MDGRFGSFRLNSLNQRRLQLNILSNNLPVFTHPCREKMKTYTLDQVQDELIGRVGTADRDQFEYELQMDLIGKAIKQIRLERHLTQEELGRLIGVQKAQISRLESNASNATVETLMRVFAALKAKVTLQVELPNLNIRVSQ